MQKNAARLRVLVAEDSHPVQRAIVRILRGEFDIVGLVSTGLDLVDAARALGPDLIVSDLDLPSLTGPGALKAIRTAGNNCPFVLLTASVENPRRWIAAGAISVVDKRDMFDELVTAVYSAAAGEIYISRSAIR